MVHNAAERAAVSTGARMAFRYTMSNIKAAQLERRYVQYGESFPGSVEENDPVGRRSGCSAPGSGS
jgi:hypothetical protein